MRKLLGRPEPAWIISAVLAATLLATAMFLPLWRMELVAPQYPEGLVLYAYGDHFEGDSASYYDDIREINGLNHYIGMKPIKAVTEMSIFTPGMIAAIIGIVAVSFISWQQKWFHLLTIAGVWFIPIFFVADLQYWLYHYGHTMDSSAALNTGDFTPRVIGRTQVWNFHSENSFQIGFFLMVAAALVITFLPRAIQWYQARHQRRTVQEESLPVRSGHSAAHGKMA